MLTGVPRALARAMRLPFLVLTLAAVFLGACIAGAANAAVDWSLLWLVLAGALKYGGSLGSHCGYLAANAAVAVLAPVVLGLSFLLAV